MPERKIISLSVAFAVVVILAGLGVGSFWRYHDYRSQERHGRYLEHAIQSADMLEDDAEAVRQYAAIEPALPEVQIRILQRQWAIALDILHQIQQSKYNPLLEKDVPDLYRLLQANLDQIHDRSGSLLAESGLLRNDLLWQAHNLAAAARLMTAFTVLERERNWPKVQGMIKEAIAEFKMSIEAADHAPGNALARNIPRWNLELLHAQQYVEKFTLFKPDEQNRMELKENLEMLIPERGGYAPGEPINRGLKK